MKKKSKEDPENLYKQTWKKVNTVSELKKWLEVLNDDEPIFMYSDEEGNEIDLHPVSYDETGAPVTPPRYPDLVTLIVTPQEAVTLNFLIYSGAQLTLALRSPTDADVIETNSVTLNYFMNTYSVPLPEKLPYGMTPSINELAPPELPNGLH